MRNQQKCLIALILSVVLASCSTTGESPGLTASKAKCEQAGFTPGTDAYAQCIYVDRERRRDFLRFLALS
jgi:hypothetical protein